MYVMIKTIKGHIFLEGRLRRRIYWPLTILYIGFIVGCGYLQSLSTGMLHEYELRLALGFIALSVLLLSFSAGVLRLHDTDRSGFSYFIFLLPIVGGLILLLFLCQKGSEGTNRFGPAPGLATSQKNKHNSC